MMGRLLTIGSWSLIASLWITHAVDASGQAKSDSASFGQYQLVMKSSVPAMKGMGVLYSPDERFAAITGDDMVYIYNLRVEQEIRRLPMFHVFSFGFPYGFVAFDSTSTHLYVRSGQSILDCSLIDDTDCQSLRDDVQSGFDMGVDGRLAYISKSNIPTVFDPRSPSAATTFPETVSQADVDGFTWHDIALRTAHGIGTWLILSGSVDRESETTDQRGHTKKVEHPEWHVSSFDVDKSKTIIDYRSIPVDVNDATLTTEGHILFCGPDQAVEDRLGDKSSDAPIQIYDLSTQRYLVGTDLSGVPVSFKAHCMDGPYVPPPSFGILPPNTEPSFATLPPGWKSPKGDLEITAQVTGDGGQVIFLEHLTAPKRIGVLAGGAVSTDNIALLPGLRLATTGGSTHLFDFHKDTFSYYPEVTRFSADGTKRAYFELDPSQARWKIRVEGAAPNDVSWPGVVLKAPTKHFGISNDGNIAYAETSAGFRVATNGTTHLVLCVNNSLLTVIAPGHPVMDPSGALLGAFCERDPADPTSEGTSPYFVVWNLHNLTEIAQIPASGFVNGAAIGSDGHTVILFGRHELRITDTTSSGASEFSLPLQTLSGTQISSGKLEADGTTLVVAVNPILGASGRIAWIDLTHRIPIHEDVVGTRINDLQIDSQGNVAVLTADNVVRLYDGRGKRLAQLMVVGPKDWLVFSEEGMFDGSANALQWAGFRTSVDAPLSTVDLFFNELYSPGLLSKLATGDSPHLPPGIHLSTYLELPGLKLLLQTGDLAPKLRDGQATVCVQREALFQALKVGRNAAEDTDATCPRRIVLSDQSDPQGLVAGLQALISKRVKTPWDGLQLKQSGGTVHLLDVAVSRYSSGFPDVPTAVPSAEHIKQVLAARGSGDSVVDWSTNGCNGPLLNSGATKAAVLSCLEKMAVSVKPSDMVVLIFAGHGGTTGSSELFYYYPYDSKGQGDGISSAELADAIRNIPAHRIVLIVDACEAGGAVSPLEEAVIAKVTDGTGAAQGTNNPSQDSDMQGVLLIAAATGAELATSNSQVNPFMDKLATILDSQGSATSPRNAHGIADEMGLPIGSSAQSGAGTESYQPFATLLGADFDVVKSTQR